ncbi:hypothetical protein D1872_81250 [compost metagenome]
MKVVKTIGTIGETETFQDWWTDRVGDTVEIIGEFAGEYILNEKLPSGANLKIRKWCMHDVREVVDLSVIPDEELIAEAKKRGFIK